MLTTEEPALGGGPKAITLDAGDVFRWPIVTEEDEQAVLEVLRAGQMSGTEVTQQFEDEFAQWIGRKHALCYNNGTESLRAAMWACGVGAGDEIIAPSMTYWASATQALTLGAAVNFTDIDPDTLCIDPDDVEHRIGPATKAIVVVHYAGHPCPMEQIMDIAGRHQIKVIEDVSHAQGSRYKGRMVGTFGDIAAMSLMSGKSFAIGEAGIVATDDRLLFERCVAYGHYERTGAPSRYSDATGEITSPELAPYRGLPLGGYKHRINQTCSAMGRVQLKYYDQRIEEIQKAMNRFWDLLDGTPGIKAHRPPAQSGSTMGGWYAPRGLYRAEELGGLPCARYCEAVRAEGVDICQPGANFALHIHDVFHTADIFRMGQPTMVSFGQRDLRQGLGTLKNAENIDATAFAIPWFKHNRPEIIEQYAHAYRKVARGATALI